MARKGSNRCEYVTRRAGESISGQPVMLDGHGDVTQTCGQFGRSVPHTYHVKKLGTTNVYESFEGTAFRCSEHEDR